MNQAEKKHNQLKLTNIISTYTPKFLEEGAILVANFEHPEKNIIYSTNVSCSSVITSTANSSMYSNTNSSFKIKRTFKKHPRLFLLPSEALQSFHEFRKLYDIEIYQHHLVSTNSITLDGSENLFLLHFFQGPEHVQYWPNSEISYIQKMFSLNNNAVLKNPYYYLCVAYILFENKIWATDIYPSIADFTYDFKIITK